MMTDTTARNSDAASAEENTAAPAAGASVEPAVESAEALANEAAELKDKLLRALADMENLRKRTEREVMDARAYGIASFARDLLGVADNMRRALDAVVTDLRETADSGFKALLEGVELTERDLLKTLEKHGVKKFEPYGEKFDPNLHQAMFEVPDPAATVGTVVQVVQAGYMIGDRMLRPALVGIAKGGPKPGAFEAPANDNPTTQPEPQGSG